jgi:hypothetical protein
VTTFTHNNSRREKIREDWRKCIIQSLIIVYIRQIIGMIKFRRIRKARYGGNKILMQHFRK